VEKKNQVFDEPAQNELLLAFHLSRMTESSNLKFSKYVYQTMWMRNILWFEDVLRVLHSRNCSGFSILFNFIYLFIYNFEKGLLYYVHTVE
jgi:hypothetical protein